MILEEATRELSISIATLKKGKKYKPFLHYKNSIILFDMESFELKYPFFILKKKLAKDYRLWFRVSGCKGKIPGKTIAALLGFTRAAVEELRISKENLILIADVLEVFGICTGFFKEYPEYNKLREKLYEKK